MGACIGVLRPLDKRDNIMAGDREMHIVEEYVDILVTCFIQSYRHRDRRCYLNEPVCLVLVYSFRGRFWVMGAFTATVMYDCRDTCRENGRKKLT